jgi:membrane-bound ClpP family serine protease
LKANESGADRLIRIIAGIVLFMLGWGILKNNILGIIFDILGVILFVTGITGFCGLYKLLGISTKKEETPKA